MLEEGLKLDFSSKLRDHLMAGNVDEADLRAMALEAIAQGLYRRKVLSLGLAAELAGLRRAEFVSRLAAGATPLIDLPAEEVERELALVDGLLRRKKEQP